MSLAVNGKHRVAFSLFPVVPIDSGAVFAYVNKIRATAPIVTNPQQFVQPLSTVVAFAPELNVLMDQSISVANKTACLLWRVTKWIGEQPLLQESGNRDLKFTLHYRYGCFSHAKQSTVSGC